MAIASLLAAYRRGALDPERVIASAGEAARAPVFLNRTPELWRPLRRGPLFGVPLAIKDNLAVAGRPTPAGSPVLAEGEPARRHAAALERLLEAGAAILGRTHMTELAYSGLGLNPHHPRLENPRWPGRVPGGSSSGSAAAAAMGTVPAAVGTDTGGSVRIPAAFQGLFGFKPTNGLVPTRGVVPLSPTLDTVGPIAASLEDAWRVFLALAGWRDAPLPAIERPLRLAVPRGLRLAPEVAEAFQGAVGRLVRAGHRVEEAELPELDEIRRLYRAHGALAAHEAFRLYRDLVEREGDRMDPRVAARILAAGRFTEDDFALVRQAHERLPVVFWRRLLGIDAVALPTVPVPPPRFADLAEDEAYFRTNARVLAHTMPFNFLKGPAISLPLAPGQGLMLAAPPGSDRQLFALARAVEAAL